MNSIRPVSLILVTCFIVVSSTGNIVRAENLLIESGGSQTIDNTVVLTTEQYDNDGTLIVAVGGILSLGANVQNSFSTAGVSGLDLGKVVTEGFIDALQAIRFREGSQLGGNIYSSDWVVFDGAVKTWGVIAAEMIVFSPSSDDAYSSVDLTARDSGLETDNLIIDGKVTVEMAAGKTFEVKSLEVGPGAILEVSEDIIVRGNYLAASGSGLAAKMDVNGVGQGSILLTGNGSFIEKTEAYGGINNILAGTMRAKTVTVQNRSLITDFFNVTGDFVLDTDSHTYSAAPILVNGKLTFNEGATMALYGDATDTSTRLLMGPYFEYGGSYYPIFLYNGILYDGFDLAAGSELSSLTKDGSLGDLTLAIMGDSAIRDDATLSAQSVVLSGVDEDGNTVLRRITNAGSMQSETLQLCSVELLNKDDGTININNLELSGNSVLDLRNNNADNGGLTFYGDNQLISISSNSQLWAGSKTLEFTDISVQNWNWDGGIYASELRFGKGATLSGNGTVYADAVFAKGSKLILGLYGTNFGSKDVTFESGATIAMTIDPEGYGTLFSTGIIKTEDGVLLEIVDGSNFDGRTQTFCVAKGGDESEYSKELTLVNSPYFSLSQVIHIVDDGEDGSRNNTLWVEIVKVADLVDYAEAGNQRAFAQMIDQLLAKEDKGGASGPQQQIFTVLMKLSDAEYCRALGSLLGDLRANGLVAAMSQPWRVPLERAGMERLSLSVPKRRRTASLVPTEPELRGQSATPLQCNLWFDTNYNYLNLRSDGNASGGLGNRFGVNLGVEWTPTNETLFGWTFGYGNGSFKQDDGHLRINDYQFGLYGGANLFKRNFQLRGYVGYGHLDFTQDRHVLLPSAYYRAHGSTPGDSLSASLMLIRPVDLSDHFLFKPTFGIDVERISQKGFSEYGDPGIRLSYAGSDFLRTMLRMGASGEHTFQRGTIWGRLFYGIKVAGDSAALSRNQFVGIAESGVAVYSVDIGNAVFDIGLGGKHALNVGKTLWLFADYNGSFAKRSDSHTGSLGFLWKR